MRVKRHALLLLAGLAGLPSFACAASLRGAPLSYHFVDFRARTGGVFGHTYVVYGAVDRRGRIVKAQAAGFYPRGKLSDTVLSAVLPMPSYVGMEASDRHHPPSAIYRRWLSEQSYARLVGTVDTLRKREPAWDLVFFNCNAFTGEVARSVGLRAPSSLQMPNDFIRGLYAMNASPRAPRAR